MAKYWTPGQVKTRLGQSIGLKVAAQIHRHFVRHLALSLSSAADRRFFAVTPSDRVRDFQTHLPIDAWEFTTQAEGDLGCRISHWFKQSLVWHDSSVTVASVLIGADCPRLTAAEVETAFAKLADHDVVLGPAVDGGYYLIGLAGPWRDAHETLLDDIPWSSQEVYEQTVARIVSSGLSLAVLPEREDVDTINELNRLRESLLVCSDSEQEFAAELNAILGAK